MAEEIPAIGESIDVSAWTSLPWHADAWRRLAQCRERLPHALLLRGAAGLGKQRFALRLARALLCQSPTAAGDACGVCKSCMLFQAGTHPDLLRIERAAERTAITVEQVRALADFLGLTAHTSARKVIVVSPAEAMNLNAANALLKLLEEPPAAGTFLLVSSRPSRLPATIRSRCVSIPFRLPTTEMAQDWLAQQPGPPSAAALAQAGGAPLLAMRYAASDMAHVAQQISDDLSALAQGADDPIRCAGRWKQLGTETALTLASYHVAGEARAAAGTSVKYSNRIIQLFAFYDVVTQAIAHTGGPLDETLLLEDVLLRWCSLHADGDRLH